MTGGIALAVRHNGHDARIPYGSASFDTITRSYGEHPRLTEPVEIPLDKISNLGK